jgi:hypothetical protein
MVNLASGLQENWVNLLPLVISIIPLFCDTEILKTRPKTDSPLKSQRNRKERQGDYIFLKSIARF